MDLPADMQAGRSADPDGGCVNRAYGSTYFPIRICGASGLPVKQAIHMTGFLEGISDIRDIRSCV